MKKFTLILFVLMITGALFAQNEVVVGWTFPGNSSVADTGIAVNLDKEISTMGGTSEIQFKNGFETKAAQATGWNEGMDTKAWVVSFSTEGYADLAISSRQSSGGADPGPKDFKIQYSLDAGTSWTDVSGSDIVVENDWETGFVDKIELPDECEDLEDRRLYLVWRVCWPGRRGDGLAFEFGTARFGAGVRVGCDCGGCDWRHIAQRWRGQHHGHDYRRVCDERADQRLAYHVGSAGMANSRDRRDFGAGGLHGYYSPSRIIQVYALSPGCKYVICDMWPGVDI